MSVFLPTNGINLQKKQGNALHWRAYWAKSARHFLHLFYIYSGVIFLDGERRLY